MSSFRFYSMNRLLCSALFCILLAACQNGCNQKVKDAEPEKKRKTLAEIDQTNPAELRELDSIPLPVIKDTTGKEEEFKDSLVFARIFQQAGNSFARAEMKRDYKALASFAPAGVLKYYGGENNYIKRLQAKDSGVAPYGKILIGPLKLLAAAKDDQGYASAWYCLTPVRSYASNNGNEVVDMFWLGGEADIKSKKVTFINVSRIDRNKLLQVMPNLSIVLDRAEAEQ